MGVNSEGRGLGSEFSFEIALPVADEKTFGDKTTEPVAAEPVSKALIESSNDEQKPTPRFDKENLTASVLIVVRLTSRVSSGRVVFR